MSGEWWRGRLVGFDLETTSPLPEEARIVSASIALCGGGEPTELRSWLVDPGVEIPAEATAVHGISTERARAEGRPAPEAIEEICRALIAAPAGPLVIFNARYDLTVLDRMLRRLGLGAVSDFGRWVVDPAVIDKWLDRYRKSYPRGVTPEQAAERGIPSSRTLGGMCRHYGAELDQAHDAGADAVAAARLAFVIAARGQVVRRVRNAEEGRERAMLRKRWDAVKDDLQLLHALQVELAIAERARFAEY
ncbi:MAG: exonuclease domain-containing protein, partial [Solirubrobacteraceae bacterium]